MSNVCLQGKEKEILEYCSSRERGTSWSQKLSSLRPRIADKCLENLKQATGQIQAQVWPSLIVCTILSSLSLQFFSFLEQPFYENYPTLDSSDTKPFTRQDGFQNRHKVKSIAYGSTKIEFLIFQNNRVFSASAFFFSPVQIKYRIFCKYRVLEYSVCSIFYNIPCIPPLRRIGSPHRGGHHKKRQETGKIFKSMKVPHSFCNFIL